MQKNSNHTAVSLESALGNGQHTGHGMADLKEKAAGPPLEQEAETSNYSGPRKLLRLGRDKKRGHAMKLIFVASDLSGLGKGTFSASLGKLLRRGGVEVRIMKSDLYFNYDAGTIHPGAHGEVYVLADGTEVDQDFGIYERFMEVESTSKDYMTSGRVFHQVYLNEREGKYLGRTISTEHIVEEIGRRITEFASQCEVGIVELGATIGDIKGTYVMETCRSLISGLGPSNSVFALLSHFPYLDNVGELKTMGCQRSVRDLGRMGIRPDVIVARTPKGHSEIPNYQLGKIANYCGVGENRVFCLPDLNSEYSVPGKLVENSLPEIVAEKLEVSFRSRAAPLPPASGNTKIALIGKYPHQDAYVSIVHWLRYYGIGNVAYNPPDLETFGGAIIPGGWGERGTEEIIKGAEICRTKKIPCLGICLGLQMMLIEYCRNVLEMEDANSTEFDPNTPSPVVSLQTEQKERAGMGGTSRLGNWTTLLKEGSRVAQYFERIEVTQRHRHRYEVSPKYDYKDFKVVGTDKESGLIEVMELEDHPFYIGVQFHPEFCIGGSPLLKELVKAAIHRPRSNKQNVTINFRTRTT